ncbi:MAG: phosphatidylglycerophosphatase A [Pseudomonadota bacterium]
MSLINQSLAAKTFRDPRYFVALGFGAGLSRWAPGTLGTLVAVPFCLLLGTLDPAYYLVLTFGLLGFGIYLTGWVAQDMNLKDPSAIVFDEFVGLLVTFFCLPGGWYWVLAGFALFRIFDILKPWPASWCDRKLTGGLGVMLDDVVAGLYALACIQIAVSLQGLVL